MNTAEWYELEAEVADKYAQYWERMGHRANAAAWRAKQHEMLDVAQLFRDLDD